MAFYSTISMAKRSCYSRLNIHFLHLLGLLPNSGFNWAWRTVPALFSVSLSLTYILQPVCWHRRIDDLTCSVTMVSFTCTVSCGPLAISSWAQLLEKLPTGTGHNYISIWPLKKFHFDVMPLKGTNGFKPWIVVANHISWFLHLWQTELLLSISVSGLLELNGLC